MINFELLSKENERRYDTDSGWIGIGFISSINSIT